MHTMVQQLIERTGLSVVEAQQAIHKVIYGLDDRQPIAIRGRCDMARNCTLQEQDVLQGDLGELLSYSYAKQ